MITTKAEVLNYIRKVTEHLDFKNTNLLSAQYVSQTLSISRSLASQYLNELYREHYFIKISSRPVLYLHKEVLRYTYGILLKNNEYLSMTQLQRELDAVYKKDDLYTLIGSRGSLEVAVDQVKASISYPPNGLPLLLIGKAGTGKRTLVRSIYKFASEHQIIQEGKILETVDLEMSSMSKVFDILNTGEIGLFYVTNVQNIKDHELQLLLDLINQETKSLNEVRLIVSATSSSDLPTSITHEIPLKVKVKDFEERYLEERQAFVIRFFKEQSRILKRSIKVSEEVILLLANNAYEGQLKHLQRTIQSICATANADVNNHRGIEIHPYHLEKYISQAITEELLKSLYSSQMVAISEIEQFDENITHHANHILLSGNDLEVTVSEYVTYLFNEYKYDQDHVYAIKEKITMLFKTHPLLKNNQTLHKQIHLISLLIYTLKINHEKITQWEHVNNHLLKNILLNVKNEYGLVFESIETVSLSIYNYMGIQLDILTRIILVIDQMNESSFN